MTKSRNFNGHFNLTNGKKFVIKKDVNVIRFAHAHLRTIIVRTCASSLDFDRGFVALPGPAGRTRLLCC